jgi:hypothetical protein
MPAGFKNVGIPVRFTFFHCIILHDFSHYLPPLHFPVSFTFRLPYLFCTTTVPSRWLGNRGHYQNATPPLTHTAVTIPAASFQDRAGGDVCMPRLKQLLSRIFPPAPSHTSPSAPAEQSPTKQSSLFHRPGPHAEWYSNILSSLTEGPLSLHADVALAQTLTICLCKRMQYIIQ